MANHNVERLDDNLKGLLATAPGRVLNIAEIRENIMLRLDSSTLSKLISVSCAALATFERDPATFIESTLNSNGVPRRWAIAILEAYWNRPDDDVEVANPESRYGCPLTELNYFLKRLVQFGNDRSLPEDIPKSLETLRKLASVHDAASDLLSTYPWTFLKNPGMVAIDSAKIWKALWIYQLHCELFHPPGNAVSRDVLFPSVKTQRLYLGTIKEMYDHEFMVCLRNVYRDLSSFLAGLFRNCWPEEFCKVYMKHSQRFDTLCQGELYSKHDWPYGKFKYIIYPPAGSPEAPRVDSIGSFWSNKEVVYDTQGEFFKYIDYQMSMGLPYVARMYRKDLASGFTAWEAQHYRTNSFFTEAFNNVGRCYATLRDTAKGLGFMLEPVEEGAKGFHLTMTVPSSVDDYFVRSKEPIFTDGEFTPLYLGNLTRVDGRIEEEAIEKEAVTNKNIQQTNVRMENLTIFRARKFLSKVDKLEGAGYQLDN